MSERRNHNFRIAGNNATPSVPTYERICPTQSIHFIKERPIPHYDTSALINAVLAMVIYGTWAAYANAEHGRDIALTAGAVQASYAFASTLSVSVCALWAYQRFGRGGYGILLGFGCSFALMLAIPLFIHTLLGTPELWLTILPGLIWGSMYIVVFLLLKERAHKQD